MNFHHMNPKSIYSLHPSYAMEDASKKNLIERTGKTLEQWIAIVKKSGPNGAAERGEWLKKEHGHTTNYASWIADCADGKGGAENYDPDKLVDEMFTGKKAGLRPIYDKLLTLGLSIGKDAKACPCQTIVPLFRNHVFAQIKPTTHTRIDMGFALKDTKPQGKLIDTGGFQKKDRITHRIPITNINEIDADVKKWMKVAYDMDAKQTVARP